ncbi:hypothetical protein NKR23_g5623 [Pleurostoma richardsiae]|uniref:Uncharacterized protein n=1 Tax=Pleurostoma richardsiae TaxID=41990 RepID=A0AA38RZ66_9PEZI|nr:hypothetical protein NKR23_g5623 [Pleurostoma richardsiae]
MSGVTKNTPINAPVSAGGGSTDSTGPAPTTKGPHKYDLLNKLDPSVNTKSGTSSSGYGPGVAGSGDGSAQGPHKSQVLNALDPKVEYAPTGGVPGSGTGAGVTEGR